MEQPLPADLVPLQAARPGLSAYTLALDVDPLTAHAASWSDTLTLEIHSHQQQSTWRRVQDAFSGVGTSEVYRVYPPDSIKALRNRSFPDAPLSAGSTYTCRGCASLRRITLGS